MIFCALHYFYSHSRYQRVSAGFMCDRTAAVGSGLSFSGAKFAGRSVFGDPRHGTARPFSTRVGPVTQDGEMGLAGDLE